MKKFRLALVAMLIVPLVVVFAACGAGTNFKLTEITMDGETIDVSTKANLKAAIIDSFAGEEYEEGEDEEVDAKINEMVDMYWAVVNAVKLSKDGKEFTLRLEVSGLVDVVAGIMGGDVDELLEDMGIDALPDVAIALIFQTTTDGDNVYLADADGNKVELEGLKITSKSGKVTIEITTVDEEWDDEEGDYVEVESVVKLVFSK